MKKNKAKSGNRSLKQKASRGRAGRKPVDLEGVRREIDSLVGNSAVELVQTTIAEANKGHYAAMKYLFEMVGLYPAAENEEASSGEDSLARTLLRRIGASEDSVMAPDITKDCGPDEAGARNDAVE
jgi:hypothetical protein